MSFSLGEINYQLGADTTRLRQSVADIARFEAAFDSMGTTMEGSAAKQEAAFRRQTKAVTDGLQQVLNFNQVVRNTDGPGTLINDSAAAFKQYSAAMTAGTLSARDFNAAQIAFRNGMATAGRGLKQHQRALKDGLNEQGKVTASLYDLGSAAVLVAGPLSGIGARISSFSAIANRTNLSIAGIILGLSTLTIGFGLTATGAIKSAIAIERFEKRLQVLVGSSRAVAQEMQFLQDVSDRAGIFFGSVSEQFSRFAIAAKNTTLEGKGIRDIFESVSLASGKMQLSVDETTGVFRALEQMLSKGTVQAEELRGQLGDRLTGAFKIAAQAMGVTTSELNDMLKAGKVVSEDFLPKFAVALREFYNIGGEANQSLFNNLQRLQTAFFNLGLSADKTFNISTAFNKAVVGLTRGVNYLAANMDTLKAAIKAAGVALAVFYAPAVFSGIQGLIALMATLRAAILAINFATLANPLAAIPTIAVKAGAALVAFATTLAILKRPTEDLRSEISDLLDELNQVAEFKGVDIAPETVQGIDQLSIAREGLEKLQEAINSKYDKDGFLDPALFTEVSALKEQAKELSTVIDSLNGIKPDVSGIGGLPALTKKELDDLDDAKESFQEILDTSLRISQIEFYKGLGKDMVDIEALLEADEIINGLSADTLAHLAEQFKLNGLETTNLTETLAGLIAENERYESSVKDIERAEKARKTALDNALKAIDKLKVETASLASVNTGEFFSAEMLDNLEATSEVTTKIADFKRELKDAGVPLTTIKDQVDTFTAALMANVEAQKVLDTKSNIADAYEDARDDVSKLITELTELRKQYDAVQDSADSLQVAESFASARELIADLDPTALAELTQFLKDGGIEAASLEDALAGIIDEIETLSTSIDDAGDFWVDRAKGVKAFGVELATANDNLDYTAGLFDALTRGGLEAGKEFERAFEDTQYLRDLSRELLEAGFSADEVTTKLSEMETILAELRGQESAIDDIIEDLERLDGYLEDTTEGMGDFVREVITGTATIKEAFQNLMSRLANIILDALVIDPFENYMKETLAGIFNGARAANEAARSGSASALSAGAQEAFGGLFGSLNQFVTSASASIGGLFTGMVSMLGNILNMLASGLTNIFSSLGGGGGLGGLLSGGGGLGSLLLGGALTFGAMKLFGSKDKDDNTSSSSEEYSTDNIFGTSNGVFKQLGVNDNTTVNYVDNSTINAQGADPAQLAKVIQQRDRQQREFETVLPRIIDGRVNESTFRRRI